MSMIQPPSPRNFFVLSSEKSKVSDDKVLDDNFFKNLDPKTLFSDQYTPTSLKEVDLQTSSVKPATVDPKSEDQKLIIDQNKDIQVAEIAASETQTPATASTNPGQSILGTDKANQFPIGISPFDIAAKEKLEKQLLVANVVKIALSGAVAAGGAVLITHGFPIGGVLVKQPYVLAQMTAAMVHFSAMLIPAIAAVASNEKVQNGIKGIIKSIKQLLPVSKVLMFSGHGQKSLNQSPAVQYLTTIMEKLQQFSAQIEHLHDPNARVESAINLQKQLLGATQDLIETVGEPDEKLQLQHTDQFLKNYESYINELPSTAKVYADIPISTQRKLQKALYHALKSNHEPLVQWAQVYCENVGTPAQVISDIIHSSNL